MIIENLKIIGDIAAYTVAIGKAVQWTFRGLRSLRRKHTRPAKELITRRVKMREEIEKNLQWARRYIDSPATETHLATKIECIDFEEIIIIDINRMNEFPKIDEHGVGISPWFKVDVVGFYRKGIEVFLSDSRKAVRTVDPDGFVSGWRLLKEDEKAESAIYAVSIGRIPFDFIESVDWSRNDGYYNAPIFYCRFAGPLRGPYEDVVYKANLYPEISRNYHDLDLRRESYEWGMFRRRKFLLGQDIRRCWRWLNKRIRRW
jgi:hypothetical protein